MINSDNKSLNVALMITVLLCGSNVMATRAVKLSSESQSVAVGSELQARQISGQKEILCTKSELPVGSNVQLFRAVSKANLVVIGIGAGITNALSQKDPNKAGLPNGWHKVMSSSLHQSGNHCAVVGSSIATPINEVATPSVMEHHEN